jgi:hypothetical protein
MDPVCFTQHLTNPANAAQAVTEPLESVKQVSVDMLPMCSYPHHAFPCKSQPKMYVCPSAPRAFSTATLSSFNRTSALCAECAAICSSPSALLTAWLPRLTNTCGSAKMTDKLTS